MRTLLILVLFSLVAAFDSFGLAEIMAGLAKAAFLVLPVVFAISLFVGFCARRKA